jgi:hypothetical protein
MPKQKFRELQPSEIREARKYLALDTTEIYAKLDEAVRPRTRWGFSGEMFASIRRTLNSEFDLMKFPKVAEEHERAARFLTNLHYAMLQYPNRCAELQRILSTAKSEEERVAYLGNWLFEAAYDFLRGRAPLFLISTAIYRLGVHIFFVCPEQT